MFKCTDRWLFSGKARAAFFGVLGLAFLDFVLVKLKFSNDEILYSGLSVFQSLAILLRSLLEDLCISFYKSPTREVFHSVHYQ